MSKGFKSVRFTTGGDGVVALYSPEGKRIAYGDEYHNKIEEWIEGFICGVVYPKKVTKSTLVKYRTPFNSTLGREVGEEGELPPKQWKDFEQQLEIDE